MDQTTNLVHPKDVKHPTLKPFPYEALLPKISCSALIERVGNADISDRELRNFFKVQAGKSGFDFKLSVDPARSI